MFPFLAVLLPGDIRYWLERYLCRVLSACGCREAVKKGDRPEIERLTGRFYTVIPHSFGRQRPPLIQTEDQVKAKFEMCNVLSDIETAQVRRPLFA